ncbi:MAG: hypothetical protein Kow0032_13790 [Methyloligellaceae bacterium]
MSIRPPRILAPKDALKEDPLSAALEHEVLAEKAATYSRLLDKLQKALARLEREESEEALAAAGEALWYVMIQRDLCGFRRHDAFYREYRIPAAVRLRMGLVRSR